MSATLAAVKRKIQSAQKLESVIGTMKSLAASAVGQFEEAVVTLDDYATNVQKALVGYFRTRGAERMAQSHCHNLKRIAIVFGSDLGMVGRFNESLVDYAVESVRTSEHQTSEYWAIGERTVDALAERGLEVARMYNTPDSIPSLKWTITRIVNDLNYSELNSAAYEVLLFYNQTAASESSSRILLPFNKRWFEELDESLWVSRTRPDIVYGDQNLLTALIREYLFVSLFRVCAKSIMSENTVRLAYMENAEDRIEKTIEHLSLKYRQERQREINRELFDIIAGYEAITQESASKRRNKRRY